MLSSLFGKLSLILVAIWGFFFWQEPFTLLAGAGLLFSVIALWLCLYGGKAESKSKLRLKWIGYVLLYSLGNAGCSIVQRNQQIHFDGQYGNFLMLIASGTSLCACLVLYLFSDKSHSCEIARSSWYFPVLSGILNALLNLFVILLATSPLSPSLIYPLLAVGSLLIITLTSFFGFKEKMRWWQWCGVLLGAVAIAILSL